MPKPPSISSIPSSTNEINISSPVPPYKVSDPNPPFNMSSPASPYKVSSPSPPFNISSPSPATKILSLESPYITSFLLEAIILSISIKVSCEPSFKSTVPEELSIIFTVILSNELE